MKTDLFTLLELEGDELRKGKNILVTDANTDGSFILSFYVAAFIKEGYHVCLAGFAQSFVHYSSIAGKLGINLADAQRSGKLSFIDGLKLIQTSYENLGGSQEGEECNSFMANSHGLQYVFQLIYNEVSKMAGNSPVLVVLDEVNTFLHFGISVNDVADFLHYFGQLSNLKGEGITTVALMHCDNDVDDEEVTYLKNASALSSDVIIGLSGLRTGFSRDVHGEIEVIWTNSTVDSTSWKQPRTMQYKLNDRNVSVFARGTSSAVL